METKPYNIQSPEGIAKEYAGNKQRIAQATQMGLLDPTAAVLAGMFIDRMRMAQSQEQVPQQTVAQQVLTPQPQMPQQPMGAGLGATPQAAQLAAAYPADGQPPPIPGPSMPGQGPVMAAEGGLLALPVDNAMFEPSYSSGGIVAFARGADEEGVVDERERARLRRMMQERFGSIPEVAQQLATMSVEDMRRALGEAEAAPVAPMSEMTEVPMAPTSPVAAVTPPAVVDQGPAANVAAATTPSSQAIEQAAVAANPEAAQQAAAQGGAPGLQAYVDQYKQMIGAVPEGEGMKEYRDYLQNLPGQMAGRKKEDLYTALTQFGFGLAGSQSPYFLQAAGQAGAQTMPTITGAIKDRRAAEAEARKGRAELDKMTRAEDIKAIEGGAKLYGEEMTREQQLKTAEMNRRAQLEAANITAGKPTDMRSYVDTYVRSMRAQGDNTTPDQVLQQKGYENYLNLFSAAGTRAAAATTQAETAATRAETELRDKARDNVDKSLSSNYNSPENIRLRELKKEDRRNKTNTAEAYVQELYSQEEARLGAQSRNQDMARRPPVDAGAPTTATAPQSAIPSAAIQMLRNNPTDVAKQQFDAVFGAGAAARVLGNR
jgi:hypothetical protein